MMIPELQSSGDFDKYLENNKFLVANFTAEWCGPCQTIKPILDSLYVDVDGKYAQIEIVRINLDRFQDLASKYSITSVPSFIFFDSKSEIDRVVGGNIPLLTKKLQALQNEARGKNGARNGLKPGTIDKSPLINELESMIPSGFVILNGGIDYSGYQVLNGDGTNIKDVFDLSTAPGIASDADSQLIVYVPLLNSSKIHSIYLKLTRGDSNDEWQLPNVIKIWTNLHNIISFDDIETNVIHQQKIDPATTGGWYQIKLKFVKFQNISSLNMFFDGEDEDSKTTIDKIVLVGLGGDALDQGTLARDE